MVKIWAAYCSDEEIEAIIRGLVGKRFDADGRVNFVQDPRDADLALVHGDYYRHQSCFTLTKDLFGLALTTQQKGKIQLGIRDRRVEDARIQKAFTYLREQFLAMGVSVEQLRDCWEEDFAFCRWLDCDNELGYFPGEYPNNDCGWKPIQLIRDQCSEARRKTKIGLIRWDEEGRTAVNKSVRQFLLGFFDCIPLPDGTISGDRKLGFCSPEGCRLGLCDEAFWQNLYEGKCVCRDEIDEFFLGQRQGAFHSLLQHLEYFINTVLPQQKPDDDQIRDEFMAILKA